MRPLHLFGIPILICILAFLAILAKQEYAKERLMKLNRTLLWGNVAKQAFPTIDTPIYATTNEAHSYMKPDDRVLWFKNDNDIYVYPLFILGYHHIVNDTVGNLPIAVTHCMLSDSSVIFDRSLIDGHALGVNGQLYLGNLVMYDKKSDDMYLQMTGQHFDRPSKRLGALTHPSYETWEIIQKQANIKVLKPVKPLEFYRAFYGDEKNKTFGMQTLMQKDIKADPRMAPFTKGLGIIDKTRVVFLTPAPDDTSSIAAQFPSAHLVRSYWFAWSALFPSTTFSTL